MGIASWYDDHIVPRFIKCACSAPGIMGLRARLVPLARGKVFEIGCGGGINQQFYDAAQISSYAGIDPSEKGLEYAREAAARKNWDTDIRQGFGEDIPFAADSFDTVVCTYTLCSVVDPAQVLAELRRILRPSGKLLFLEHGRAPDAGVAKWQDRIEPVWKRLAGGCQLTRSVSSSVASSGLEVTRLGQGYLPKTPRFAGWMEWGEGIKAG